jgi:hypothetical protein
MRAARGTPLHFDRRPPAATPLLGLEHEFQVFHGAEPVDFRTIVGSLRVNGRRIDPSDPSAYRCSWGGVITADGREAEVAIAPVECRPGFIGRFDAEAMLAHRSLREALPPQLTLRGYSTHLSVGTPTPLTSRVASIYTQRFAAPMMLLLDRRDSPGLLVRTRPGRTELCGEYATGRSLRGAAAFATGSVLASIRAVGDRRYRRQLPPIVDVARVPAVQRTGWFIDRMGFGTDLYAAGRAARLQQGRGTTTAQHQLEAAWAVARESLITSGLAHDGDLVAADRMVAGRAPLPVESTAVDEVHSLEPAHLSPFGDAIADRVRRWGRVSAAVMSWDIVIFAIAGARNVFAAVPRHELDVFLADLDADRLDDAIERYLHAPPNGSCLMAATDVKRASLYDNVSPTRLAPVEPPPGAPLGRVESMLDRMRLGDGGGRSRDEKHRREDGPQQPDGNVHASSPAPPDPLVSRAGTRAGTHAPKLNRGVAIAAIAGAVVVLAAGVALATRGGDDPDSARATTTVPGSPVGSSSGASGSPTRPSIVRTGPQSTLPPTTPPIRFRSLQSTFSSESGYANGTCEDGTAPGRVMVWVGPDRSAFFGTDVDQPPSGVDAYEMTWVGADRYEVLFPRGEVDIGDTDLDVVADCSGATTRKAGKSLLQYGIDTDIENKPITDQPFVIISGSIDPRRVDCPSPGKPVEAKVLWGVVEDGDFDRSTIFAEEPMRLDADGVFRATVETRRYFDELMIVGHYETTSYRCDWGNG